MTTKRERGRVGEREREGIWEGENQEPTVAEDGEVMVVVEFLDVDLRRAHTRRE